MPKFIREYGRTWTQKVCTEILKQGPMPKNVALILDGNRRWARAQKLPSVTDGHRMGFNKIHQLVKMFLDLGISEMTLYMFSIENFKRSQEEVKGIMELIRGILQIFIDDIEEVNKEGVCFQVVGDWAHIPSHLKCLLSKAMVLSRNNTKLRVNFALAYTARREITLASKQLLAGLSKGDINVDDLSEDLVEEAFRLYPYSPVDIMVRTSGETRLSDYLMWQTTQAYLDFQEITWPEFSYWNLLHAIFLYQTQTYFLSNEINDDSALPEENVANSQEDKFRKEMMIASIRNQKWHSYIIQANEDKSRIPIM